MFSRKWRLAAVLLCSAATVPAQASETVTFTYDALGRLVQVSSSGSVNDGIVTATDYDPEGNRSSVVVGTGSVTPPPPPPPANSPPVTTADSASVQKCKSVIVNVLANDSDPEGNTPLTLMSVTQGSKGTANISGSSVHYLAGTNLGQDVLTYTVKDSLGATSTGTLTITVMYASSCSPDPF